MRSSSRSSSRLSSYSRGFDIADDFDDDIVDDKDIVGGPMLPVFLNDLTKNRGKELVEVTLELGDDSIVVCGVADPVSRQDETPPSRIRRKLGWLMRSGSFSSTTSAVENDREREREKLKKSAQLQKSTSTAHKALKGLRFINKTTGAVDSDEQWRKVESKFQAIAKDGLLAREDFGECIGMDNSKEFAVGIFDALARRKRQRITKITKEELHDFWLQISDQSFDARLQIFFDMADSNQNGKITKKEVQELVMLSASANKLSKLKEQAEEYATLIMEELDPDNDGYIELWQLETLLLKKDTYLNYSRPLSTASVGWQTPKRNPYRPQYIMRRASSTFRQLVTENWRRGWVLLLWITVMAGLFTWKFFQYRSKATFQVMGYCIATAKGAAETLKLNMALVLLPVCRNTLTWLRSTRARFIIPFDDNINFHKIIATAIVVGVLIHTGNHLLCDFPRLINSSPEKFALISSDFHNGVKPTYKDLLIGIEGVTGILMVILMAIAYILATRYLRKNRVPAPFKKYVGFNSFWYAHHLFGIVYILLIIHGTFLFFAHKWDEKTTWMYISVPLLLYIAERSLRTCRSEHYSVKIIKVSVSAGDVFSLTMSKPPGFKYTSGQYIFLLCPAISSFEWHPFSITSAPGDDFLSVHIRTVGDWTEELKRVFTEGLDSGRTIGRAKFGEHGHIDQTGLPRLCIDGPYGAPAQDYKNYDVLLLVGLGIGATPFISILRDIINNSREEKGESSTENSRSDCSSNSFTSSDATLTSTSTSTQGGGKKRPPRNTRAYFYWVTREPWCLESFKGIMDEVADMDHRGQIELHNYLTSVYEEGDARSTLITMVQALNHAKHGVDILSGTRVRTHFARPNWKEVFTRIASKNPYSVVGVFYCGLPPVAKELKKLSQDLTQKTTTRFEFHKEYF